MKEKSFGAAWALGIIKDFFTKNVLLKAASLAFAVIIWAAIISIDNPLRRLPLSNVSVRPVNYQNLESKNLAVTTGEASLFATVDDVVVEIAQQELRNISAASVNAYIDLNDVSEPGTHELTIKGSISGKSATLAFTPPTVTVHVEELSQKLVPVAVSENGTLPDGYRIGEKYISPNRVIVKGPRSVVESITRAVVDFPLDSLQNAVNDSFIYRLLNSEGQEVSTEALIMTDNSVIISASVEPKEEKPVVLSEDKLIGDLPEGYRIKSIEIFPQTIQIAGPRDALDEIDAIEPTYIDIDGKTESFTAMVDIQIPNGVTWMQAEQLSVQVNIAEDEETKIFTDLEIEVINAEGKDITFDDSSRARLEIRAARSVIRRLLMEDIEVYINLASYDYGPHDVPIEAHLRDQTASAITITPATLHVEIKPLMMLSE